MVTRMISDPLFPAPPEAPDKTEQPVTWVLSHPHPLVPSMKVVRMFVENGGIAVYSAADDGSTGMRNLIPLDRTRLVEEAMPLEVFIDELGQAESDANFADDDDDDSPETPPQAGTPEEPQTPPTPEPDTSSAAAPPPNGSAS
jgi:hypothetical protein